MESLVTTSFLNSLGKHRCARPRKGRWLERPAEGCRGVDEAKHVLIIPNVVVGKQRVEVCEERIGIEVAGEPLVGRGRRTSGSGVGGSMGSSSSNVLVAA
jgi:hypothetical protein